jgi:hypothetical protein
MPRSKTSGRGAMLWDRVALALLLTALVVGLGLGGAGSLAVRTTTTLLALASCGAIGLSCLCEGRWRFVGGSLWILPLAVVAWAGVQFFVPPMNGGLTLPNGQKIASISSSWNTLGTLQFAAWGMGLLVAMFAAAHAVRSASRMRTFAAALGCTLLFAAGIGMLQSARGSQKYLGLYDADDRSLSAFTRDWISNETSFGARSASPWRRWEVAAESTNDPNHRRRTAWLEPNVRTARFGSYLNASDWAAAAGMLAPFLLAAGACYLRRLTSASQLVWDVDAPQGLAFALVAAILIAAAAALGDPIVGIAGFLFSLMIVVTMAPKSDRAVLRRFGFLGLLFAVVAGVGSTFLRGGTPALVESWRTYGTDSAALSQILLSHWQLGTGFGSIGDVWPMHRTQPLDVAPRGSALISMAAEAGLPLVILAVFLTFIGFLRWRKVAPTLSTDARLLAAGIGGSLAAWFAHAALGPGGDAPSVILLAAVFLGLAARGLAGAIRIPEGAWSK